MGIIRQSPSGPIVFPVSTTVPAVGDTLTWDGTLWVPTALSALAAVACRCTKSANQNFGDGSLDTITWDQEDYDTNSFHSNVLANTRFTMPFTGKYHFTVVAAWNLEDTDGYRSLNYRINGAGSILNIATAVATIGTPLRLSGNLDIQLSAGDYIEFSGLQNSGSTVSIGGGAGSDSFAAVYFIGT